MRVLVVEDDKDLNRQIADALVDAGYVVDRAFDGEEGHFLGDTEPYDAVVLDLGLPVLDGVSVLEVGPGPGGLTRALIAQGARVVAIERDERAIAALGEISAR